MTHWQLSCGHWESELDDGRLGIGAPLSCTRCGSLRTVIVGYSTGPLHGYWGSAAA